MVLHFLKKVFGTAVSDVTDTNEIIGYAGMENPTFSVSHSVTEGFTNPWIATALRIIADEETQIPWVVVDKSTPEHKIIKNHVVSDLINNPGTDFTGEVHQETITNWMYLAGIGYEHIFVIGDRPVALQLINPDRMVQRKKDGKLVGYNMVDVHQRKQKGFKADEIIRHVRQVDASDPYNGISVLKTLVTLVDMDNAQALFQKAASESRGVSDLIISYKGNPNKLKVMQQAVREMFDGIRNRGKTGVIAGDVNVHRAGLSSKEIDYLKTRVRNKEDIYSAFGIPGQFAGSTGSSFSNLKEAKTTLWIMGVTPVLSRKRGSYNAAFKKWLKPNEYLTYDLSGVEALQDGQKEKVEMARTLWETGVPWTTINAQLGLNMDVSFKGAKLPWNGSKDPISSQSPTLKQPFDRKGNTNGMSAVRLAETPVYTQEDLNDAIDGTGTAFFSDYFDSLRAKVADTRGSDLPTLLAEEQSSFEEGLVALLMLEASKAGVSILDKDLGAFIAPQAAADTAFIFSTTRNVFDEQVSFYEGDEVMLHSALDDIITGWADSEGRANRLSTTEMLFAVSGALLLEAKAKNKGLKTWVNVGDSSVRHTHTGAGVGGEVRKLNERFSNGGMFPGDGSLPAKERANCRCWVVYS